MGVGAPNGDSPAALKRELVADRGSAAEKGNVRVVCRMRPMNEREKKAGTVPAATASTERKEVAVVRMLGGGTRQVRSQFHFDEVLTSFSTQDEVFAATLDPLVDEVLSGYEATAFAYGQTGTGKTYTMEGDLDSDEGRGLVPRTAAAVIERLSSGGYADYSVTCSYLEIYNEELSDLLAPQPHQQRVDLKDVGGGKGVCCIGLSEVPVASIADILELVRRAQERRRVAETRVNARSSRSHCIFTMKVRCRRTVANGELENAGKLHLVDLAGSECAKKASTTEETLAFPRPGGQQASEEDRERRSINQSLLTLGRVISALREGTGRVPYRDSKLTRLLQDALGGRCKTAVIATISPAMNAVEETISTLNYAEQASGIRNRPVASSLLKPIRLAASGDGRGAAEAGCAGGTSSDWGEMEMKVSYLTQEVEEAQAALARKYREAQGYLERATGAEDQLGAMQARLADAQWHAKEKAFAVQRLAGFADGRCDAAARLLSALEASAAHRDDLGRCLEERRTAFLASRRQAREVCAAAEAQRVPLAAASKAKADEAVSAVAEAHSAHRACTGVAAEITQEQQRILSTLVASTHTCSQQLEKELKGLTGEALSSLQAGKVAVSGAQESALAALAEASGEAKGCGAEVGKLADRSISGAVEAASTLCGSLEKGRQELDAGTAGIAADLEAARAAAGECHEGAVAHIRTGIQEPTAGLLAQLQATQKGLASHGDGLCALGAREAVLAAEVSAHWQQLLDQLGSSDKANSSAAAAGQASLHAILEGLGSAVGSHGQAAETALEALGSGLTSAQGVLAEATRTGRDEVGSAVQQADTLLVSAWAADRNRLQQLADTLKSAGDNQREANAAEHLQQVAGSAALALVSSLGSAVQTLAGTRESIAQEVERLQEQRAAERELVAGLTRQREQLQADVAGLQATLEELNGKQAQGREQLEQLQASQERGRARLFEVVSSAMQQELKSLGTELSAGVATTTACFQNSEVLAGQMAADASATEERSATAVEAAVATTRAWSAGIGASCGSVESAQERAREAAESVDAASAAAALEFKAIESASCEWGRRCQEVGSLVDVASQHREELLSAQQRVEPEWRATRTRTVEAAEAWAEAGRQTGTTLSQVASERERAFAELGLLRDGASARRADAEEVAATWERDADAHASALAGISELATGFAGGHREAAELRSQAVEDLQKETAGLSSCATQHCAAAGRVLAATTDRLEAMPAELAGRSAELEAAGLALRELCRLASSSAASAAEGVAALSTEQQDSWRAAQSCAGDAASKVAAGAEAGKEVLGELSSAATTADEQARRHWQKAEDEQHAALALLGTAVETAKEASALSTSAGSGRVLAELDKGAKAKDRAVAATEKLAAGAAQALAEQQAAMQSGLAAEPLAAFEEGAVPQAPACPQEAMTPNVNFPQRPSKEHLAAEFRSLHPQLAAEGTAARLDFGETPPQHAPPHPAEDTPVKLQASPVLNIEDTENAPADLDLSARFRAISGLKAPVAGLALKHKVAMRDAHGRRRDPAATEAKEGSQRAVLGELSAAPQATA